MDQQQIIDRFMAEEITAEEMVAELAKLRPREPETVNVREEAVPASLVRAQAAIRRINRGRR